MIPFLHNPLFIVKLFELFFLLLVWLMAGAFVQSSIFCCAYWGLVMLLTGFWTPTVLTVLILGYHMLTQDHRFPSYVFNAALMICCGLCLLAGSIAYFTYAAGFVAKRITTTIEAVRCGTLSTMYATLACLMGIVFFGDAAYTIYRYVRLEAEQDSQ